jgi:large conductance mechanosensitive channel
VKDFLQDFKKFLMRGNVLDLAVAVVVGAAFNAVVQSLTNDILLPFIAAIGGQPSFNDLTFSVGDGVIRYGAFITNLLNFVIIAFSVFVVVKFFEQLQNIRKRAPEEPTAELTDEARLLVEIRDLLAAQRPEPGQQ